VPPLSSSVACCGVFPVSRLVLLWCLLSPRSRFLGVFSYCIISETVQYVKVSLRGLWKRYSFGRCTIYIVCT
jgi:hypothetical protein